MLPLGEQSFGWKHCQRLVSPPVLTHCPAVAHTAVPASGFMQHPLLQAEVQPAGLMGVPENGQLNAPSPPLGPSVIEMTSPPASAASLPGLPSPPPASSPNVSVEQPPSRSVALKAKNKRLDMPQL